MHIAQGTTVLIGQIQIETKQKKNSSVTHDRFSSYIHRNEMKNIPYKPSENENRNHPMMSMNVRIKYISN